MKAAIFYGPGDLRIEDVPPGEPGPGEIAVDVKAAATCGTDLKSFRRGHPKLFPVLPARFGHEFAGVISAVGEGVTRFKPGMRVAAANTAPCGTCWACTIGRETLCENLEFLNGAFAEQVIIPAAIAARNTYELPPILPSRRPRRSSRSPRWCTAWRRAVFNSATQSLFMAQVPLA